MAEETNETKENDIDGDDDLDAAFDDAGGQPDDVEGEDESTDLENGDDSDEDDDDESSSQTPADGEEVDDEDPSDVEDDLGTILKERLVAEDEEDPEPEPEDKDLVVQQHGDSPDEQFVCNGCFLKVSASQFGAAGQRVCPNGEDPCPSVAMLGG